MTEYWVSKSRHYCELCNAWMADTQLAIRTHENGAKHKQMVSMRIKQAREDGAKEKRDAKLAQQNMERIEALAQKQYERDLMDARSKQGRVAEAGTTPSSGGGWILDNRCGYYYDEASGYYYDPKSEMYFKDGVWSERPGTTVILPAQTGSESNAKASAHRGSIEDAKTTTEYAVGYGTLHPAYEASLKRKSCPSSSPERRLNMGHVGASRGITVTASGSGKKTKRVVEGASKGGKLTKEESEALARREAARRRVESRTLDTLGLQ